MRLLARDSTPNRVSLTPNQGQHTVSHLSAFEWTLMELCGSSSKEQRWRLHLHNILSASSRYGAASHN